MLQGTVSILRASALLFAISFALVVTAFGLVEDSLFFQSDARSAFVFVTALSGIVFVALGVACGALALAVPRSRAGFATAAGRALATLILAGLVYFCLAWLDKAFRIFGLFRKLDAEWLFLVLWALILAGSVFLIHRLRNGHEIAHRTARLALVASPLAVLGFGLHLAEAHLWPISQRAEKPRHAVLVVLDGWPAQHLRAFNPDARPQDLDALLGEQAMVFRNVHTNAAWTNGFFGTLYKGSPKYTFSRLGIGERLAGDAGNLLKELQGLGASTRIMSYHRNGLPEGSASTVSDYAGLRSVFLSFEHVPFLEALGLEDYNLVIPGPGAGTVWGDQRKRLVRRLLGPMEARPENPLTGLLLPQMRDLRKRTARSFTLFHTGWDLGSGSLPAAWDEGLPKGDAGRVTRQARQRDYRYDPEDEWYATRMRHRQSLIAEDVGERIAAFVALLEAQDLLKDTLLIFTADHGSIYGKGRIWYGYHPEEEVLRVPFFMLGAGKAGINDDRFESIDIVQSLIEHFGGSGRLHPRARSMLGDGGKPYTTSVTLRSDANREWFLAIYRGDRKFLFNLHPKGDGLARELALDGFDGTPVRQGAEVLRAVRGEFDAALDDYGLARDSIHPSLH